MTSEFPPQPGGIGNHALHLAHSLQKEGYEVTVLTNARTADGIQEAQYDTSLPFRVQRVPRYSFVARTYLKRMRSARQSIQLHDIVLASGKFSLWLVGFWSLFFKRKYIAVVHGSELRLSNGMMQQWTQFCLKRFHRLIAVSNFTKHLIPKGNYPTTEVIPNGFEIAATAQRPADVSQPRLITVGNITQRKGQHQVVNGLPTALQKFPKLKYTMVGIPTEQAKIESLAAALGVLDAIHCTGKVSEEEKIQHLQQATLFVMLSKNTEAGDVEGFGIAILEANALGIPAIGALHCGIEDAIDHGKSGLLIEGDDAHALVAAIEEITENYQAYAQEAIQWSSQFRWEAIVKRYIHVIEQS